MLKGIPNIMSPELLKILMEMGHGDEIVIGDANFPAASMANKLVRFDGHNIPGILEAILELFPLDSYCEHPVSLMAVVPGDNVKPIIWDTYKEIISNFDERGSACIEFIDRFDFYERARKSYAIVATSERALYGCIILKKGIIK